MINRKKGKIEPMKGYSLKMGILQNFCSWQKAAYNYEKLNQKNTVAKLKMCQTNLIEYAEFKFKW